MWAVELALETAGLEVVFVFDAVARKYTECNGLGVATASLMGNAGGLSNQTAPSWLSHCSIPLTASWSV